MIEAFEPRVKLDDGFYADARAAHVSAPSFLASLDEPPQEHITAATDVFHARYANRLRPANASAVEDWARGRAALANQLTWYEQTSGKRVLTVHDFYNADNSITSLFPAWLESEIQASLLATGLVAWLTMGTLQADSAKVTALYDSTGVTERSLRLIGQGAELPIVKLTLADSTINLNKFGRAVQTSYEAIAMQRIDALGAHFRRIVAQVAIDETDLALHTLIAGDGTTAGAAETNATDRDVAVAGTIAYSDLVNWTLDFDEPYQCDKAVCGDTDLAQILNMAEFKDNSYTGGGGNLPSVGPKSVNFARWSGGVTGSSYVDRLVIGIDSRSALQKYTWGGFIEETDSIINKQIKQFTFSYYAGFRKWDAAACVPLDANAVL
jgi:hypothetical protein